MSIFDSIMGDMSSFSDALLSVGANEVEKSTKPSKNTSETSSLYAANLLSRGQMSLPYRQGDEFVASKSKPAEQTDPETINQQWLRRLNRYAEIATPTSSGARAK